MVNLVKQRISEGKATLGGWCLTGSVVSAEILASSGFDWVCIDAEHSAVNPLDIQNLVSVIAGKGAEPIIRVALNDEKECKKALDAGASGIIVPMVKCYRDVDKAVGYVKFPPQGQRSFALSRCTDFGINSVSYFARANDWTFLAIMIEHVDVLRHLDRILANQFVDAIFVGPYDLSGSMNIPGQFDDPGFRQVLDEIQVKASKHHMAIGLHEVHPTKAKIEQHVQNGYQLIACGIDTLFIHEAAKKLSGVLENG